MSANRETPPAGARDAVTDGMVARACEAYLQEAKRQNFNPSEAWARSQQAKDWMRAALESAIRGKADGARTPTDEIMSLFYTAMDNLGDMPINEAWAARWVTRANTALDAADASKATQPAAPGAVEDRALDTSRRRSAVELLLSLGYKWHDNTGVWLQHPSPNTAATGMGDAVRIGNVLASMRRLALVIRKYGTCAPLALDHIADDLDAALAAQPAPVEAAGSDGDDPMTPEQCVRWLDAKYARHGEGADRECADMIRRLSAQPAPVVGGDGYAEQHERDSKELRKLCESRDFYKRRCEALQAVQSNMRDPERKAVCDILANGSTALLAARPGGEGAYPVGSDREVLLYLMQQFDGETWNCARCGHAEDTATMDSADYLRRYLAAHPAQAGGGRE